MNIITFLLFFVLYTCDSLKSQVMEGKEQRQILQCQSIVWKQISLTYFWKDAFELGYKDIMFSVKATPSGT